jgi:Uncharacterized conserved protein
MGQPAARALIDTAGHTGIIATGSLNVLINGFPAARKGDTFPCACLLPPHVAGFISMGSMTVNINGLPAARMGDVTGCLGPPPPPVPPGFPPIPAPPVIPGTIILGSLDVNIG